MAILTLTNAAVWRDLADLTARVNEVTLDASAKAVDSTTFASNGWSEFIGGLRSASLSLKGLWDAGTPGSPDDLSFGGLGVGGKPITVVPQTPAVGGICYFGTFLPPSYKTGGKVGDILAFDTPAHSDAPLVRGQVANITSRTATATTTALQLGAIGANQRVYAALHVLSVGGTAGPSLTVTVQGDTASTFPSPTTFATGAAITAPGSQFLVGPGGGSADSWFRLSLVIAGTSPSFLLYAALGIA